MEDPSRRLDRAQLKRLQTSALIRQAVEEAQLLARCEMAHAKEELKDEVRLAKRNGILLGAALALFLSGLAVLFAALGVGLPLSAPVGLLLVGASLCVLAAVVGGVGVKTLPRKPLPHTQSRLKENYRLARRQWA